MHTGSFLETCGLFFVHFLNAMGKAERCAARAENARTEETRKKLLELYTARRVAQRRADRMANSKEKVGVCDCNSTDEEQEQNTDEAEESDDFCDY